MPAAAEASLDFLLRFQIRKPITPATMAMTATPPTTPPAMAPAFEPPPSLSFSSACEEVRALGSGVPEEAGTAWTEVVVERVPSESECEVSQCGLEMGWEGCAYWSRSWSLHVWKKDQWSLGL